jgi:hypothetical protein
MVRVTSVPDPSAQPAHKGESMHVRYSIFLIIFKIHIDIETNKWFKKLQEKNFLAQTKKKILL